MPQPKHTGIVIRDQQERADRLTYARAWHIRMKPHFDALYGSRTCHGPACSAARGEVA